MYLGAGISAWTAISSTNRMKEQTMLDLKSSSLIWEYCETKMHQLQTTRLLLSLQEAQPSTGSHYLSLHVGILEHLGERCDVLVPHPLAAPNLHGLTDPLVDLP